MVILRQLQLNTGTPKNTKELVFNLERKLKTAVKIYSYSHPIISQRANLLYVCLYTHTAHAEREQGNVQHKSNDEVAAVVNV